MHAVFGAVVHATTTGWITEVWSFGASATLDWLQPSKISSIGRPGRVARGLTAFSHSHAVQTALSLPSATPAVLVREWRACRPTRLLAHRSAEGCRRAVTR